MCDCYEEEFEMAEVAEETPQPLEIKVQVARPRKK
jgi:hypothetical protein